MARTDLTSQINRILAGLSSFNLEFESVESLREGAWNAAEILMLKLGSDPRPKFVLGTEVDVIGFPVEVDRAFAGLAVMRGFSSSMAGELVAFADLVSTVLETRLNSEAKSEKLRSLESRIQMQEGQSNVRPLRPTRLARIRQLREQLEEREARDSNETESNVREMVSLPLLIENMSEIRLARLALELHERSGRWAFLSLEDLAADTIESRDNLKALGGITLFIRDLSKLTVKQQVRLAEYLSIQPSAEMPQVIAGVQTQDREQVLPHLLSLFSISQTAGMSSETASELAEDIADLSSANDAAQSNDLAERENLNVARLIPFDLRLLDPDQAPVH